MSGRMIIGVLAVALALTTVAFAQEPEEHRRGPRGGREHEMDRQHRQPELEAREAERNFQREMRELELDERRAAMKRRLGGPGRHEGPGGAIFLAFCVVVNILLTVWVYQDMRKRNAGSGLWIAITLLIGFLGALLYAIVRLGDMRQEGS